MESKEIYDVVHAAELRAPNLKVIEHYGGDHCVCCTEAQQPPKRHVCDPLPSNIVRTSTIRCLCHGSMPEYKKPPKAKNERDILFRPVRWKCKPSLKVSPTPYEPCLGTPVGLSQSSFSMGFLETSKDALPLMSFATDLIALAEFYITPEFEWDEKVLNRILFEGHRLYTASQNELTDGATLAEESIKRKFVLCDNAFDVMVHQPFVIGRVSGQGLPIPNLHWSLEKFFKKFQFCLLQVEQKYMLIWKNLDVYFVFDSYGRRAQDFRTDSKEGTAMLICLRHLDNVSHLIHNLSDIEASHLFVIRHIQLKSLVPCGGKPTPAIVDRESQFEIENSEYAVLRGTVHLGSNCFKEIRNRQSLPIAISALVNSKIDAPPTWDSSVIDKIVKMGAHFYKRWTQCDSTLDLGIQDVPNRFVFGQYIIQIAVNAVTECGFWKCTPNFRTSELSQAIQAAFERGSNLLLQIQGRSYAIWKKGAFYYVLDPYSHQCTLGKRKLLTASLRMCGTIEKLCCVVTQALLELFEKSKFVIHLVKILKIEEIDTMRQENERRLEGLCMCIATPHGDEPEEANSLNDSVRAVSEYDFKETLPPIDYDSGDLDSPGMSQTRLEDYTDFRKDFVDSDEDKEDEDVVDLDVEADELQRNQGYDTSDDEFGDGMGVDKDKEKRLNKDGSGRRRAKDGDKKSKEGRKRDKGESEDADDEMDQSSGRKKKKDKKSEDKDKADEKDKDRRGTKRKKGEGDDEEDTPDKKMKTDRKSKSGDESETDKKAKKNEDDEKAKKEKKDKDEKGGKGAEKKTDEKPAKAAKVDDKAAKAAKVDDKAAKDTKVEDKTAKAADSNKDADKKDKPKKKGDSDKATSEPTDQDGPTGKKSPGEEDPNAKPKQQSAERRQKHQRRKQQDGEDTSSEEIPRQGIPAGCMPNSYPGFTEDPQDLAVVGSESGSYGSLCCLLKSAFRCADRVLTMTPWGNYVAFRANRAYFIFDGCTCNLRSIRHMDLSVGTAGLLCFPDLHSLITYIENGKRVPEPTTSSNKDVIDKICSEYCGDKCQ